MSQKALAAILADPQVNEVMWNGYDRAFIEFNGALQSIPSPFQSAADFESVLKTLAGLPSAVHTQGLAIDGVLGDGSRFHITLPPLSPDGPTLTIRKFSQRYRGLAQLTASGFMTEKLATFLDACVKGRINILVSGSTGAGKTSLLNTLASQIGRDERVITIEDVPEIQLNHPNWVRLVALPAQGAEGRQMSVRDCLVGCLRMRPDRIIVGECRSSEAQEMLETMNSGHDGGMTTIHANSSGDALGRLETLVLFHGGIEIPIKVLRKRIADAIDLVIQVKRGPDGRRFIDEVVEVVGMEGDVITRLPIFKFAERKKNAAQKNDQPRMTSTGHPPTFLSRLEARGVQLPRGFFDPQSFESAA